MTGWHEIPIMCQSGAKCLSMSVLLVQQVKQNNKTDSNVTLISRTFPILANPNDFTII